MLSLAGPEDAAATPPPPQQPAAAAAGSEDEAAEGSGGGGEEYIVTFAKKPFGLKPGESGGVAVVSKCSPGGNAETLGVKAGDVVLSVGGEAVPARGGRKALTDLMKKAELPLVMVLRRAPP